MITAFILEEKGLANSCYSSNEQTNSQEREKSCCTSQLENTTNLDLIEINPGKETGIHRDPIINKNIRIYEVTGLDCTSCAKTIENHLNSIPVVKTVRVSCQTGKNACRTRQ